MSANLPAILIMLKKSSRTYQSGEAERGLKAHRRPHDQGLFGIWYKELVSKIAFADNLRMIWFLWIFQGIRFGGLAVGETHEEMNAVLDFHPAPLLPENKPRSTLWE